MNFLLVAILLLWSGVSSVFPFHEKRLRSLVVVNAVLTALALLALAVPAIDGVSSSAVYGLVMVDRLRGLLLIPLALSWMVGVVAFVLWWGASFEKGEGTRPLFCVRNVTLVSAFAGVLLMLLTNALPVVFLGLLLTITSVSLGTLFRIAPEVLHRVRMLIMGLGGALLVFAVGVTILLIQVYRATDRLMFTLTEVRPVDLGGMEMLTIFGIVFICFASMWCMGLLPAMGWYRKGIVSLPKGHRLVLRIFLPVVLFPHLFTLVAWAEMQGVADALVEKIFLLFTLFAALTLLEYLRSKQSLADTVTVLLSAMILMSLAFGPAGAIPALMMLVVLVLLGTLLLITNGGAWWPRQTWWKPGVKKYAVALCIAVPFLSPLFVPYALSIGYGVQMMPIIACVAVFVLLYATYSISSRMLTAWSEADAQPYDMWSARIAGVLLVAMTIYGCWFMYADTLSLFVEAAS